MPESKVQQQIALLEKSPLTSALTIPLRMAQHRMANDTLRVLFVGDANRGKSSLLNALIGKPYLAAHASIDAIQNEFVYGESPRATWTSPDGVLTELDLTEIVEQFSNEDAEEFPIARVSLPLDGLHGEVVWAEYPLLPSMTDTEVLPAALYDADVVVYVLAADAFLSLRDQKAIERLLAGGLKHIIFVCNRFDLVPEDDREEMQQYILRRLETYTQYTQHTQVLITSARQALAGQTANDTAQIEASGIDTLLEALTQLKALDRQNVKRMHLEGVVKHTFEQAEKIFTEAHKTTAMQATQAADSAPGTTDYAGRLEKRLEFMRARKVDNYLRLNADLIQDNIHDFLQGLAKDTENVLQTYPRFNEALLRAAASEGAAKKLSEDVAAYVISTLSKQIQDWHKDTLTTFLKNRVDILHSDIVEEINSFFNTVQVEQAQLAENQRIPVLTPEQVAAPLAFEAKDIHAGLSLDNLRVQIATPNLQSALMSAATVVVGGAIASYFLGIGMQFAVPILLIPAVLVGRQVFQTQSEKARFQVARSIHQDMQQASDTYSHLVITQFEALVLGRYDEIERQLQGFIVQFKDSLQMTGAYRAQQAAQSQTGDYEKLLQQLAQLRDH